MRLITILLYLAATPLRAGGLPITNPGQSSIAIDSGAGAYAGNQGVQQRLILQQGGGGTQRIEAAPAMGSTFANNTATCWVVINGQLSVIEVGLGGSAPFKDVPCAIANNAKDQVALASVLFNMSTNDPAQQEYARQVTRQAIGLIQATDPSALIAAKAYNIEPPIRPMHRLSDFTQPGGIMVEHIEGNPDYKGQPVVLAKAAPRPAPPPAYERDWNPELDKRHTDEMAK
jgi:hypothetical protein